MPPSSRTISTASGSGPSGSAAAARAGGGRREDDRKRGVLGRAGPVGLAVSLCVHLVVIAIAALVTFSFDDPGRPGDAGGEPVEFAVIPESQLANMPSASIEADTPAVEELASDATPEIQSPDAELDVDLAALTGELSDVVIEAGGGTLSAGGVDSLGGGIGGEGASFFGVEASGRRFAYVADRSGSMDGAKIERLRAELSRSVMGLGGAGEYAVLLFSSDVTVLESPLGWRAATEANRRRTAGLAREVMASGGTTPLPALTAALAMNPPPDAIYFMTDADNFPRELPAAVEQVNRKSRVAIHCILFTDVRDAQQRAGVERVMQQIANDSRGSFTLVIAGGGQ